MIDRWDRAARLGATLGLAAVLAGCGGGGEVSSPTTTARSPAPSVAAVSLGGTSQDPGSAQPASASPIAAAWTPSPTAALPSSPPAATLAGLIGGGTAAGMLGSYTWAGGGSDSPWLPGEPAGTARAGGSLQATFGELAPGDWSAAWARVANGVVGAPAGGTSGVASVSLSAPPKGGAWSVRVTASFGPGANATYYWLVTVTP